MTIPALLAAAEHYTLSSTHLETVAQHQIAAAGQMLGGNSDKWAHHVEIADNHVSQAAVHSAAANKHLEEYVSAAQMRL